MTSLLGSGRRCHLARAAAALASSLDFLQGTSEKIHLQGLLCQKLLQAMDFLAVSRQPFVETSGSIVFSSLGSFPETVPYFCVSVQGFTPDLPTAVRRSDLERVDNVYTIL